MQPAKREHLPEERKGFTHRFEIITAGRTHTFYLTCGLYPDRRLGEIFIRVGKMGSTLDGVLDGHAIAVSIGLQYGVPLEAFTTKMRYTKFEPAGPVTGFPEGMEGAEHNHFQAQSPFDYIAAYLTWKFPKGKLRGFEEPPEVEVLPDSKEPIDIS